MKDIMLDLETMGAGPEAAIIAIGAVAFDPDLREIGVRRYWTVNLASAVAGGGIIDPDTVLWWMLQSDAARVAFARPGEHINQALCGFAEWAASIAPANDLRVWGNGAAFDNVILASAYRRAVITAPWKFYNDRCYRTLKAMRPEVAMRRSGTHHNAVDDAESQARHLIELLSNPRVQPAATEPAQPAGRGPLGCDELLGADHQLEKQS